jgi:methionyl-tRNA formyltransferase
MAALRSIMRVVILTSLLRDGASLFLPHLVREPGVDVRLVVFCHHVPPDRWKRAKRRLGKLRRIGPLGALTGLYLRRWDRPTGGPDLHEVAGGFAIPVEESPRLGCDRTRQLVRDCGAEVGLTIGTAIVPPSVFEIPVHGMINVHGDVLPRFRGGRSVVWPIYEGVCEAGFSIHRIDRGIDTGALLYVERFPIELRPTLRETYEVNTATIQRRAPPKLAQVVGRLPELLAQARVQRAGEGTTYTTPTFWQFLRMLRQHRRMLREAGVEPAPERR